MIHFKFSIPSTDEGTRAKITQFRTGFAANFSALGYDAGDLDAVSAAATEYSTDLAEVLTLKDAYRNAVAAKDSSKSSSTVFIREWAERVKTNSLATTEILATMGITPVSAGGGPVNVPATLGANPTAFGTCKLSWNANGNLKNTTYVIEGNTNGGGWTWIGNTTKKAFEDTSATAGVPKLYRVRAQRAGVTSAPSAQASIYGGEEGVTLQVAA